MARTLSNMVALGTPAFDFSLPDTVSGNQYSLRELKGEMATLIMFICNHCPFVVQVNPQLVQLARDYFPKGVGFIAISSNDVVSYPDDSPDKMKETAMAQGYPFPYLFDETQEVAKNYEAACTPDFFLYDQHLHLVYRGQLDDSRPGNGIPVTGRDIRKALDCLLAGLLVPPEQRPGIGCNIKWKN
ncbi:MAG: redoxin domain-containing protein [Terrimonas sp.]|nr:redoxin domain-containing protein [Terrimonas sp.]